MLCTFQSQQGCNIVVVEDSYIIAPLGSLFLFFKIQVWQDPHIVVVDNGYTTTLLRLKCLAEKK